MSIMSNNRLSAQELKTDPVYPTRFSYFGYFFVRLSVYDHLADRFRLGQARVRLGLG